MRHVLPSLLLAAVLTSCGSAGGPADGAPAEAGPDSDAGDACAAPAPHAPHAVLDLSLPPGAEEGEGLADPCVIRVDDTWYLYATGTMDSFSTWASGDLIHWEHRGVVWEPVPGTWNERGQAWAPHVQAGDGGFYLYYTKDKQIGVAWSPSPEGPFEELYDHPFLGGGHGGIGDGVFEHRGTPSPDLDFEEFSIDAFVLAASDGSLTFYATRYTPLSTLVAIPMADLRTLVPGEPVTILEPDMAGWEKFVTEAPWVDEVDSRFLLTYSGNGADRTDYALGAAWGDGPLGPFEKAPQNPFLQADPGKAFFGPGHHSIVEGFCGERLLFYHTKVSEAPGWERRIRVAPVVLEGPTPLLPPLP
ncbi:MAG: family 43 glycosylhydrolase [Deltaproteobacteria bacterium]|nr:family 43 glycosylhydrolase [Deltaproteobacteria bacterium]